MLRNMKNIKIAALAALLTMGISFGAADVAAASPRHYHEYDSGYEDGYYDAYRDAYRDNYYRYHRRDYDDGDLAAAVIVGAIIGAAASR